MTRSDEETWHLREADPPDATELVAVHLAARRDAEPAMPPLVGSRGSLEQHLLLALDPGRRAHGGEVWVAERRSRVIGYVRLDRDWLDDLYVHPDAQGLGVGSALLGVAQARRRGGFSLWVFESNQRARQFYRRHGLWELERTDGAENEERTPDLRMAWPGEDPLSYLRDQIDDVDEHLARALARRAALTRVVQAHKPVPGEEGRDLDREREIARRMAAHTPELGEDRLARIMHTVISESLAAAEDARPAGPTA